ncbi:MAG: allantoicase [Myxococcales bacterium]|nr:MAG: allantoicase [Myxococcales bacterium]
MSQEARAASFNGLIDLASAELGGEALATSDDFFASAQSMLAAGPAVFVPGKYTERGKWMDGWESRRKRGPGHDYCLVRLGVPGEVAALDIDTAHFIGNHPAFASVEGTFAPAQASAAEVMQGPFQELLAQAPLLPGSHNLFVPRAAGVVSHLRLNIFPDGGVARFRAYGKVAPSWRTPRLDDASRAHVSPDWFDLAALENGALALACSDAHFGGMNNLLLPGRAANMGSGWETRRRRGPGHDWIVIALAARGAPRVIEVDTNHFKGNFPERCAIDMIDAEGARPSDLVATDAWRPLLEESRLRADDRHFFAGAELSAGESAVSHVRLRIFPDGGVSRLRVWGERSAEPARPSTEALDRLNSATEADARDALSRCCGAARWVEAMVAARPFSSARALLQAAADAWRSLQARDYLEAFSHHPEIGSDLDELRRKFSRTAELSRSEQAGAASASEETLVALRRQNQAYRERFGYAFIVCATGKSAEEMLGLLEQRLLHSPELEIVLAAAEQAKITQLRLEKL